MTSRGGGRYQPKNFLIHAKSDGSRYYYEHDDRGGNRSSGGGGGSGGGNSGGRGGFRNSYHGGGKFRGGGGSGGRGGRNNWDGGWDDERSSRCPEYGRRQGHWRGGNRRGGGRGPRGPQYKDDDVEMGGSTKNRYRRQDMYKSQGRRRDHRNNRNFNANNSLGWHKILIRDASSLSREEVLESIKELVREPFIPVMYEVEGKNLVFYLEDNGPAAQAITEISRRITMASGQRLNIHSNRSPPPNRPLTPAQREQVTLIMSQRYSVELKRLDLKSFHNDANLVKEGIFCPLYRLPNMQIIMDIVVSNVNHVVEVDLSHNKLHSLDQLDRLVAACPNLIRFSLKKNKIVNEVALDKLTGLGIVELTLEGNPLCDKFRDSETYIRQVAEPG